jgi:putative ABC transport system permease protein
LSFILLVSAGLLIKSFINLRHIDPGFSPDNVLALRVAMTSPKYDTNEKRAQLWRQLVEQLKATPGVESVGAITAIPLRGDTFDLGRSVIREGLPEVPANAVNSNYLDITNDYFQTLKITAIPLRGDTFDLGRSVIREGLPEVPANAVNSNYLDITNDYFQTLKIPLKAGRTFNDHDNLDSPKVAIISEQLAHQLWPGEDPIGKRFHVWRDEKFSREVVGVVGSTKKSLDEEPFNQTYVPVLQDPNWGALTFVVRTAGEPTAFAGAVREAIRSVDNTMPTYNLKTMDDVVAQSAAPRRLPTQLLSVFAGIAMLLAMIGIYGITSYYVTQRTHEIGVRMALGAQIADVLRLVLQRAMLLAIVGVGIGIVGAVVVTRYLTSLLFGVKPVDVITFVGVALVLFAVALIACLVPARRAAKIDPLVALRYE